MAFNLVEKLPESSKNELKRPNICKLNLIY